MSALFVFFSAIGFVCVARVSARSRKPTRFRAMDYYVCVLLSFSSVRVFLLSAMCMQLYLWFNAPFCFLPLGFESSPPDATDRCARSDDDGLNCWFLSRRDDAHLSVSLLLVHMHVTPVFYVHTHVPR